MQNFQAFVFTAVLSTVGASAVAVDNNISARGTSGLQAANTCKVGGESCSGTLDCCSTFYCATRGLTPEDYKCHFLGKRFCGVNGAICKDDSHCCGAEGSTCVNEKCSDVQPPEYEDGQ